MAFRVRKLFGTFEKRPEVLFSGCIFTAAYVVFITAMIIELFTSHFAVQIYDTDLRLRRQHKNLPLLTDLVVTSFPHGDLHILDTNFL